MKYLKLFLEHNNQIEGYYYNVDDYDEDVPDNLLDSAYKLAANRGIRISGNKNLLYAFYNVITEKVVT